MERQSSKKKKRKKKEKKGRVQNSREDAHLNPA